jgi:hypothetical protein
VGVTVRWRAILPLLVTALTPLACARSPRTPTELHACASLDAPACERARALTLAATTYADEAHEYVLASAAVSPASALARTKEGWRALPLACARAHAAPRRLDPGVVDYAFVGVVVDGTLVSADADVGALLARPEPRVHDVRLVALAFVRDLAPATFDPGASLLERPTGECLCGDATHFAGATKYGAMLSYSFSAPRRDGHVGAIELVRAALVDPHAPLRESRVGSMTIDGIARFLSHDAAAPLAFHVIDAAPIAYLASPVAELCDFPAPEVSPSPLDFGVAPYGTEARRTVHVVNRSAVDLRALLGASTFVLPAGGAIDLPLRWTPDGDAPGCETQTRDEAIPFLRLAGGTTPRTARVLETIRTGRPSVERIERVEPSPAGRAGRDRSDLATIARDWTCPRDFARTSCRAENTGGLEVVAEPRGEDACHFACPGPGAPGRAPACRFDAVMGCALKCSP